MDEKEQVFKEEKAAEANDYNEEISAEFAPPVFRDYEDDDDEEDDRYSSSAGKGYGWAGLIISLFALFYFPVVLGAVAIVIGFVALRKGAVALGSWSIGIGALSVVLGLFIYPFF